MFTSLKTHKTKILRSGVFIAISALLFGLFTNMAAYKDNRGVNSYSISGRVVSSSGLAIRNARVNVYRCAALGAQACTPLKVLTTSSFGIYNDVLDDGIYLFQYNPKGGRVRANPVEERVDHDLQLQDIMTQD